MTGAPVPAGMRPGFAMVFSLLLIMALAVLSAGMLAVADQEARITGTVRRSAATHLAAESAVRRALALWSTRDAAALAVGTDSTWRDRDSVGLRVRRFDGTRWLLTARALDPGPGSVAATAGVLVRTLDPDALAADAAGAAAFTGDAVLHGGAVSAGTACAPESDSAAALVAGRVFRTGGVVEGALIEGGTVEGRAFPRRAPLPWADMADVRAPPGVGTPRPAVRAGECVAGPWGWGSTREDHPCAAPRLIYSAGDLALRGGEGVGVLVVDGDLTLTGDFTFHGLVSVSGRVLLDGATIRGSLRSAGLEIRAGLIQYHACLLRTGFDAPAFDRAFRPPDRWWVPTF